MSRTAELPAGDPSVEENDDDDSALIEARKIVSHQGTTRPHLIAMVESDKDLLAVAGRILREGEEEKHTWPLNPVHAIAVKEYVARERMAVRYVQVTQQDLEACTGEGV